ncbi:class I adenylate-forming enzyme family protein [Konateibacter massiliensis]|uniref:class I adenylate-forming enzyme family protein n=1 Tax=Konateibacter massiliensis TaxID=2002841 RepID=UPI000C147278|nr:AMP-binding protein [Konateibacter massiliensis]
MQLENITVDKKMADHVRQNPNDLALEFGAYRLNWKKLNEQTDCIAIALIEKGIKKGTHVGLFGTNSLNWVCTYLALAKIGAVSVLINFNNKKEQICQMLNYADIAYLCYGDGYKEQDFNEMADELRCQKEHAHIKYIPIGEKSCGLWKEKGYEEQEYQKLAVYKSEVKSSDFLSMIFTSGTTAQPKGVLLTQYQMLNIAAQAASIMKWSKSDKICLALALFHCFGLSTGLLAGLCSGASVCLLPGFRSTQVLEAIETYKCTVINGVPSMFLALLEHADYEKYDLSSLKSGIIAGSGVRSQDYVRITSSLKIPCLHQSYGQTEASPSITFSLCEDSREIKAVSVGRVMEHMELRITDKCGKVVSAFVDGEVQIKGYNVMQHGYYKKDEETALAFSKDGWLKTGDIGHLDEDGNLFITGRIKDIIIRCGENISPKEIEEVISEYSGIKDVKVFGIPAEIVQEEIVACIVAEQVLLLEDLKGYLRRRLPDYKLPKYIYECKEFPLQANGKLDIGKMKEHAIKEKEKTILSL